MADDEDWFGGADDDLPPPPPEPGDLVRKFSMASQASQPPAASEGAPGSVGEGGEILSEVLEKPESAPTEEFETEYLDPDRLLLCRHWIRPKFLQYKYLFDYRQNYYDDVIDYLDKKQKGQKRELPRPQTWAERALRTYSNQMNRTDFYRALDEDKQLATKMKLTGSFYHYHSREYFNRKYSSIL